MADRSLADLACIDKKNCNILEKKTTFNIHPVSSLPKLTLAFMVLLGVEFLSLKSSSTPPTPPSKHIERATVINVALTLAFRGYVSIAGSYPTVSYSGYEISTILESSTASLEGRREVGNF